MGDAEHLEAAARGPDARAAVCRRAADLFVDRGFAAEARALFERALRYRPSDARTLVGLGRSFQELGLAARALDVFTRAAAMAERTGADSAELTIAIARALVEVADDRPAAIARVRGVGPGRPETLEARLLEGRWRAELGDRAGAGVALGRLRDAGELAGTKGTPESRERAAQHLAEGADIEESARGDLLAAQRLLGLAMRLAPRDRRIRERFRVVSAELERERGGPRVEPRPTAADARVEPRSPDVRRDARAATSAEPAAPRTLRGAEGLSPAAGAALDPEPAENDEAIVAAMTDRVRANPADTEASDRLAGALERLGRDLELCALLSARVEDADDAARPALVERRRAVLTRLAEVARREGRPSEAEVYESMRDAD